MSPLDDELRTALSGRVGGLTPSSDLLAGVERRARRMRRNQVASTVVAAAFTAGAVGLGGPMLASTLTLDPAPPTASAGPSAVEEPSQYALIPGDAWPYRGESVLKQPVETAMTGAWARRHGLAEHEVELTLLYGQDHTGPATVIFVAQTPDLPPHWGVAEAGETRLSFLVDVPLEEGTTTLQAVVPGFDSPVLLVLASPELGAVSYCPVGPGSCVEHGDDGFMQTPLDGDSDIDTVRVLDRGGAVVFEGPAADPQPSGWPERPTVGAGDEVPPPSNVVDWPARGGAAPELVEAALTGYAEEIAVSRDEVGSRLLYGYQPPGRDRGYLLLQVWAGGDAQTLGVEFDGRSGDLTATALSGVAPVGAQALAVLLPGGAGGVGQLLVVPAPTAGQVLYAPSADGEARPVADQGTGAAVLVARPAEAKDDRLLVLDGDGDLDRPLYEGTVEELLARSR